MNIYWCYPSGEDYGLYVSAQTRNEARMVASSEFCEDYINVNAFCYKKDVVCVPHLKISCADLNLIKKFGLFYDCERCDDCYSNCFYPETQKYFRNKKLLEEFTHLCCAANGFLDDFTIFAKVISKTENLITIERFQKFGNLKLPNISFSQQDFEKYYEPLTEKILEENNE